MFPSRTLAELCLTAAVSVSVAIPAYAADLDGATLYKTRCAICHDGPPQDRMPSDHELSGKPARLIRGEALMDCGSNSPGRADAFAQRRGAYGIGR
jgi:cytochrome c5